MQWLILQATVTAAQIEAQLLAQFAAGGLPTSAWVRGGIWDNLTKWIARLLLLVYTLIQYIAQGAFLDTASGQALADLAAGTFGTAKREETFANGYFTLTNNTGSLLEFGIEECAFEHIDDSSVTYKNSEAISIANGASQTFSIVCDIAGTAGNALASKVQLQQTIVGATGTNSDPVVGQDAQTDASLRDVASKQASSLSDGHANKFEWYALNTNTDGTIAETDDGKTRCNINRVAVTNDSTDGTVTLVLASPSGPVDSAEYTTVIGVINQYVLANPGVIDDYNATAVTVNIEVDVVLKKGSSTSGVATEIQEYVSEWFASEDNSIEGDDGSLTVEELELLIGRAKTNIREVTITDINGGAPADVTLAFDEVATLGTFVCNVTVQS